MTFDTTTFILEIINFLVLIWILQRLFYKPLLAVIAKRKAFIDQSLADAKTIQQQADEQRNQYECLQKQWQQEKQTAFNELQQQIALERQIELAKLAAEFDQEKQKINLLLNRQQQEIQQQLEKQALENGARFAAMLLQQAASPELEARLLTLLLDSLNTLPQLPDGKKALTIHITSVYPLNPEQQHTLEQKFSALINRPINFHYAQDSALIAGYCIDMGTWVLQANLQHELVGFADMSHAFK
jgi:F-type H+-transporting ATPase subunit b